MEDRQPSEFGPQQERRNHAGIAEPKSNLTEEVFALNQQMKMFERHLEENDSELCKVKQEQNHLKVLVDEHNKRLSLLDEEILIDNIECPVVDMTAPSVNRFRLNHERLVDAQNEQFSKLAILRDQSKITLAHPNEPVNTVEFTFNVPNSSKEPAHCLPKVNGRKSPEFSDCNASVLGAIKGHMDAMAEENNECISRAVDALHGSLSAETSIIHDHLESFDDHLGALEQRMQTSDAILQEQLSNLNKLQERLEEVAGKCNGNPASTDMKALAEAHAINEQFRVLLANSGKLRDNPRAGSWEVVDGRSRSSTQVSDWQVCCTAESSTHDLHFRELEQQFQHNWKKLDAARANQISELVAFQARLNTVTHNGDANIRGRNWSSWSQPDHISAVSMVSHLQLGNMEDSVNSVPGTAHSLPTGRDLEEMVRHGDEKIPRGDDHQALLEGLQCQFSAELKALERCVEENDEKLTKIQTTMLQGRLEAVVALEDHLKAVEDRLNRTDEKLSASKFDGLSETANAQLKALERHVVESDGRIARLLQCQLSASTMLREKLKAMTEEYGKHPQLDGIKKMDVSKKSIEFNGYPKTKLDSSFGDNERRDKIIGAEPTVLDEHLTSLEGQLEGMMEMLHHA